MLEAETRSDHNFVISQPIQAFLESILVGFSPATRPSSRILLSCALHRRKTQKQGRGGVWPEANLDLGHTFKHLGKQSPP
jgi:hypothetical protein